MSCHWITHNAQAYKGNLLFNHFFLALALIKELV
jgi:hypothetical protein